jgi:TRAP-type C4-dicarboxylate transport system substrate-binding protein
MSKFRPGARALALVAGVALGALAQAAAAQEVTLKFATINAESTRAFKELQLPLARAIEAESQGRIKIDMRGSGPNGFGKPAELASLVEKGDIDIAYGIQGYTPGRFPRTSVVELPLMFQTSEQGTRALWALYKEGALEKEYDNFKILSLITSVPFPILSAGKSIAALKDFRGLRIRVPSPTMGLALAKLGAVPIGLPVNLIADSLANGMVDAISYPYDALMTTPGIGGKPIAAQITVMFDAQFAAPAAMIAMNKKAWDALPADLQAAIEKHTGMDLNLAWARDRDIHEQESKAQLEADGNHKAFKLSEADQAQITKLVAPVIADWKKSLSSQGIDGDKLLQQAQARLGQKSASAQ